MTTARKSLSADFGSIENVTGWTGAQFDETPSTGRATTPDTKLQSGQAPGCFTVSEGVTMHSLKFKSGPALKYATGLEIEFKASSDGRISGHGSVFNNVDRGGEKVLPGAFSKSLAQGAMPKMLWQHDATKPIGKWLAAREDGHGLYVDGLLNLKTTAGRDAYEHLMAGDIDGMSIGYQEVRAKNDGNVRVLEELALYEVSVVTFPMNTAATVVGVKTLNSKSDLVDLLREAGLAKSYAQRLAAGGWPAVAGAENSQSATDLAAIIDAATAQLRSI